MATGYPNLPAEVFLDTSFVVALAARTDENHSLALEIAQALKSSRTRIITTQAILLEIGNTFTKVPYRQAATSIRENLLSDPSVTILPVTDALLGRAWNLFAERIDKEWSITDCLSFVVMSDLGLSLALTADRHFKQAGFRAILREIVA